MSREQPDYAKAAAFVDYIRTRRAIQYNVERRHHHNLPRFQQRIREHEQQYSDFAKVYRKIETERVRNERPTRYWMAGPKLHCRHGIILYGDECITCEKDDKQ